MANNNLKLLKNDKKTKVDMPIDDVGVLIKNTLLSKIVRQIILTSYLSKFTGFAMKNNSLSFLLVNLKILEKINKTIAKTFIDKKYKNINEAFTHRYERKLPENDNGNSFLSPTDAYLNIREIKDFKITLLPELIIDLKKLIKEENCQDFKNGGKFLLFTLKPFHDHTVDYPIDSLVLEKPESINSTNKIVYSTDLYFLKFLWKKMKKAVFQENHRVVTKLLSTKTDKKYFFIEVGATNVNSIEQDNCEKNTTYEQGTQKSHFNFGSTVIVLLPKEIANKIEFENFTKQDINTSVAVERREKIGEFK